MPRYIRLGKFMSKVKISARKQPYREVHKETEIYQDYLNPNDLSSEMRVGMFDLLNIRPTPLIRNVQLSGNFCELADDAQKRLPAGMRFYTDF